MMNSWCIGNGQVHDLKLQSMCGTLNCMHDEQLILHERNNRYSVCGELSGKAGASGYYAGNVPAHKRESNGVKEYVVRRLSPLECTRLQGYPDGWVDIGDWVDSKGKKHRDAASPKYKALGNSIALPFWFQLLRNISNVLDADDTEPRKHTLGSLFDGISGFPYCWALTNGADTCRWESEIEEFPLAVCRKHFGDEDLGIDGDINDYINVGEK